MKMQKKKRQIINFLKERKKAKILTILFINELEKKGVVKYEYI